MRRDDPQEGRIVPTVLVLAGCLALGAAAGTGPFADGGQPGAPETLFGYTYWVQVAAHGPGLHGSQWRTDLGLRSLLDGFQAAVTVAFYPAPGGDPVSMETQVAGGVQSVLEDVVSQLGASGSGALEVWSNAPLVVTSRTYNLISGDADCTPGGTFGQYYAGYRPDDTLAIGDTAWLAHLAESSRFRTNVAFTNTGTTPAAVEVQLFDGAGTSLATFEVALNPRQYRQETRVFRERAGQSAMQRGSARVTVTAGAGVIASASVVDKITNDPTTIPAIRTEYASGYPQVAREDRIPADARKRGPATDHHPPILHSDEFEQPVPLPYPISTAGAEDSAFILPDGKTLYFFFTPDVRVPPNQQLFDDVTGVWVSHKVGGRWIEPRRVWLQEPGRLALDGAVAVQGDEMWFASAREGYTGVNMFTARWRDHAWRDWEYVGDRLMKEIQIGEVHLHGDDLYFHSDRPGGYGNYDIWVTTRNGDTWSDPVNIHAVNTPAMDGFPFVSSDGNELWFTRIHMGTPAVFRSVKVHGEWGPPEMIVSQFAAEPTLDDAGNLYFIHHYIEHDVMIEADIYVAYKK